jgi:hypothetical protein
MKTRFTSIYGARAGVRDLLWHLSARRFRMASTSEELLDLFEEAYAVPDERLPVTSSDREDKPSDSSPAAAPAAFASEGISFGAPSFAALVSSERAAGTSSLLSFAFDKRVAFLQQRGCLTAAR